MKEIKPYMDRFQEKMKIAQMTRNTAMLKAARAELRAVQRVKRNRQLLCLCQFSSDSFIDYLVPFIEICCSSS
jgi:uncharacterized membrane protein (DUF106 family)